MAAVVAEAQVTGCLPLKISCPSGSGHLHSALTLNLPTSAEQLPSVVVGCCWTVEKWVARRAWHEHLQAGVAEVGLSRGAPECRAHS